MDIPCTPSAEAAAPMLYMKLMKVGKDNSLTDLSGFYGSIIDTLFLAQPNLKTKAEVEQGLADSYLGSVADMIMIFKSKIEAKLSETTEGNVTAFLEFGLDNPASFKLRDNLKVALKSKIEVFNNEFSSTLEETIEPKPSPADTHVDSEEGKMFSSNEDSILAQLNGMAALKAEGEIEGDMTRDEFANTYFKKYDTLFNDFATYFTNNFMDNLVETEIIDGQDPSGYNTDVDQVIHKVQDLFETRAEETETLLERFSELPMDEGSRDIREAFYNGIISREFNTIVALNLKGITKNEKTGEYEMDDSMGNTRTSYTDVDGKFAQGDQASSMLKLHLTTTPRLYRDGGNTFQSTDVPHLTDYEITALSKHFEDLGQDLPKFEKRLKDLAGGKGTKANTALSLYNKFFAAESYTVTDSEGNKVKRASFAMLADLGQKQAKFSRNVVSALITQLTSAQVSERTSIINGRNVTTTTSNTELSASIQADYNISITHDNDPKVLKNKISRAVKLSEGKDGGLVLIVGRGLEIPVSKIDIEGKNGHIVKLDPSVATDVDTPANAVKALRALGFPQHIDEEFIKEYKRNPYAPKGVSREVMGVPSMIANLAYMVAMNTPANQQILRDKGMAILPNPDVDATSLDYPPFERAWAFKKAFISNLESTKGLLAKKMIKNTNGDVVASVTPSHVLGRTKALINRIRSTDGALHADNILVDTTSGWSLESFTNKDGIVKGHKSKKTTQMTMAEHYDYLIQNLFLVEGANSNWKRGIYQPGAMADRGKVPAAIIKGYDMLPINYREKDANGINSVERDFIDSEKAHTQALQKMIVGEWKAQLKEWIDGGTKVTFTQGQVDGLSDLESLQEFLAEAKIPLSKVKKSIILVNELMYVGNEYTDVDGNKHKTASIKKALIHMKNVWADDVQARRFNEANLQKFRADLSEAGYTKGNLTHESYGILKGRFNVGSEQDAFDIMTEGYFYRSNMVANSLLTLNAGSFFQFKGDMKDMSEDKRVKEFSKDATKAETKEAGDLLSINQSLHDMMTPQSKRNSLITSGMQRPRLMADDETGMGLGYNTITALIEDPEELVSLLGSLGGMKQEVYDAAQFIHPLYRLKLNNSLGEGASQYISKGGAIKDISVEVDPRTGVNRAQKKASFNSFANDLMRNGTTAAHRLFRKMNTAVTWGTDGVNIDFTTNLIVKTANENSKKIKNLQELYEHFGAWDNESAWEQVLEVLGDNPSIREQYVEKVGFKSGEKTGNRGYNGSNVWNNDSSDAKLIYTNYSNEGHGVILNADHDPDASAHKSEKALMTQIISASVLQGETADIAAEINQSLLTLSEVGLNRINENVRDASLKILRHNMNPVNSTEYVELVDAGFAEELEVLLDSHNLTPDEEARLTEIVETTGIKKRAVKTYVRKLTEEAIATRDSAEITKDLVKDSNSALDSLQLYKAVHSAVMAEINRATTKIKFKGQEFVVSASYDFLQLHDLNGATVSRVEYMKSEDVEFVPVSNDKDMALLTPTDPVMYNGKTMKLWKAIQTAEVKDAKALVGLIQAKIPTESRPLKWANYYYTEGETKHYIEDSAEYKALWDNGMELSGKGITDERKKELLDARVSLDIALKDLFADESKDWNTVDAEFYMPITHAKHFNLNIPGTTDPDTSVNIADIIGTKQTGPKLFMRNGVQVENEADADSVIFQSEYNQMIEFFKDRILGNRVELNLDGKFKNVKKGFTYGDFKNLLQTTIDRNDNSEMGSTQDLMDQELITVLDKLEESFSEDALDTDVMIFADASKINQVTRKNKELYITQLAEKQARSFPKTLTIFAARIPAQGKQSGIVGKVKGFITSNRNGMFGPAEMLTVTGADHDIDKSHVLVYSTDEEGAIYDYNKYLDENGVISQAIYNEILYDKIKKKVDHLKTVVKKDGTGIDGNEIARQVASLKKRENARLEEATKNMVLDKLAIVWRHPKNAIEAATPISIQSLQDELKKKEDEAGKLVKGADGVTRISSESFISPYTPSSIPVMERVNAIGKALVGINATGIKGYAAIYTAALADMENANILFPEETKQLFGKNITVAKAFSEMFFLGDKQSKQSINIYTKSGSKISRRSRKHIANSDKYTTANKELSTKEVLTEAEAIMVDGWKTEPQAWDNLSQLLSAATDNAKELLLGRLGIDGTTNGLVVSAITIGFQIKDILSLLADPEVKKIIKAVEDSDDTTKNMGKSLNIDTELREYLDQKFGENNKDVISSLDSLARRTSNAVSEVITPTTADTVQQQAVGVKSPKDIKLNYFGGAKFDVKNKGSIASNKSLSTDEKVLLNDVLKSNPKLKLPGSETEVNQIVKILSSSNSIIVGSTITNTDDKIGAFVEAYAKLNPTKSVSTLSVEGTWRTMKGGEFVKVNTPPVFTSNTGIIIGTETKRINEYITEAIQNTSDAFTMTEDDFNNKAIATAKEQNNKIKSIGESFGDKMSEYLTDGPRQVYQFVKMANEMRAITGVLSINGGTPNGTVDAYKFFNNFIKLVNKTDGFNIDASGLRNFIKSLDGTLTEKNKGDFATEQITKYNKVKTGFNPFYVISKNDHFFGYLKSLLLGQDLIRQATFTNGLVEEILHSKSRPADVGDDQISEITDFVYGIGVAQFFEQANETRFTIEDSVYDLTSNDGRADFIEDMVGLVDKYQNDSNLKDNAFIKKLQKDTAIDYKTGKKVNIIKTGNLNNMTAHEQTNIKLGLNKLRDSAGRAGKLHDALYYYSLILNKGSMSKDAFTTLYGMETKAVKSYNIDFLNKTAERRGAINEAIDSMGVSAFKLSNPSLVRAVNTFSEGAQDAALIEAKAEQDALRAEAGQNFTPKNLSLSVHDNMYAFPEYEGKPNQDVIKSAETNKMFVWDDKAGNWGQYVVVTPIRTTKGIPYNLDKSKAGTITAAGYQFGEDAIVNSGGETGQVKYFDFDANKYVVNLRGTTMFMTDLVLAELNPDMIFREDNFGTMTNEDRINKDVVRTLTKPARKLSRVDTPTIVVRSKGNYATALKGVNLVDAKHIEMADKASFVYGFDTKQKITNTGEGEYKGTEWITKYKGAMGDKVAEMMSTEDAVMLYGSRIEDGNTPDDIKNMFANIKPIIDSVVKAGAEVLVSNNSGIDEEIRSYIMNEYPKYQPTDTGFKMGATEVDLENAVTVWKEGSTMGRFNANNNIEREGKLMTGAHGTIVYRDSTSVESDTNIRSDYNLLTPYEKLRTWGGFVNKSVVLRMLTNAGIKHAEGNAKFNTALKDRLIIGEEDFVKRLFKAQMIEANSAAGDKFTDITSHQQLDNKFNDMLAKGDITQEEVDSAMGTMFNEQGKFNISEVGQMAMSRNRDVSLNMAKELSPSWLQDVESNPLYAVASSGRSKSEKSTVYMEMINSNTIAKSITKAIENSDNITYRDAYNFIKTFTPSKAISRDMVIDGTEVNKLFALEGIEGFEDGRRLVILNNDSLHSFRTGPVKSDSLSKSTFKSTNRSWDSAKVDVTLTKNKVKFQKAPVLFKDFKGKEYASKMVSRSVLTKVFNGIAANTGIEADTMSNEDIVTEYGELYGGKAGFTIGGKVVINLDYATLDTPLHEFGHVYLAHLKKTNPEVYAYIINESLKHDMRQAIEEKYPENTDEENGDEIFQTLLGLEHQVKAQDEFDGESTSLWQKILKVADEASSIIDFFNTAFNTIFSNTKATELTLNDSLSSIIEKVGTEIMTNKNSALNTLTDTQKKALGKVIDSEIDEKAIEAKLKKLNFIQEICI